MKKSGALGRSDFTVDLNGELCTVPDHISTDCIALGFRVIALWSPVWL